MTLASEMCGIRCCANDAASREGGMPQTFVVYGPKKSPYSVLPIACFTQSSEETSFRGQTAHEMLCLDERDAVAVLGELEAGGQSADAATHHDGVAQETSILGLVLAPLAQLMELSAHSMRRAPQV